LRAAVFFAFSSAIWALLPLVARQLLGGGASFYGILLGAVGAGAIGGALVMPRLRARMDADGLLLLSAVLTAAVMGVLSFAPAQWVAVAALLVCGAAWITALTTLNSTAQAILPNWVRGRTLAVYLTVFNGAMTGGSLAWGATASAIGVPFTLAVAAIGLLSVYDRQGGSVRVPEGARPPVARAAARRRLWLGRDRGRGRSRTAGRMVYGRILGRASAPAQARVEGRCRHSGRCPPLPQGAGRAGRQPLSRDQPPPSRLTRTARPGADPAPGPHLEDIHPTQTKEPFP